MSSKDFGEDAPFLLYLLPIVLAIIYGAYVWATTASTSAMPTDAYLIVAKSPYLFLISLVAICLAIIIEVRYASAPDRNGILQANTSRLQILAVAVLVLSFAAAFSAGGYNLTTAAVLFVEGRYALIYAFFLIGISLLLSPRQVLGNLKLASIPDILGLLLVVAAPILFWAGLKVHLSFNTSAIGAIIVGLIGLFLLLGGGRLLGIKEPQTAKQKQGVTTEVPVPKSSQKS